MKQMFKIFAVLALVFSFSVFADEVQRPQKVICKPFIDLPITIFETYEIDVDYYDEYDPPLSRTIDNAPLSGGVYGYAFFEWDGKKGKISLMASDSIEDTTHYISLRKTWWGIYGRHYTAHEKIDYYCIFK